MQVIDEETYLATHNASRQDYGDAALHKNIPIGNIRKRLVERQNAKDCDLTTRREALRKEYNDKVISGEIRPPTRIEQLIATASGMDEKAATQAARRLLEKMRKSE